MSHSMKETMTRLRLGVNRLTILDGERPVNLDSTPILEFELGSTSRLFALC